MAAGLALGALGFVFFLLGERKRHHLRRGGRGRER